jgi:hypothetical protein
MKWSLNVTSARGDDLSSRILLKDGATQARALREPFTMKSRPNATGETSTSNVTAALKERDDEPALPQVTDYWKTIWDRVDNARRSGERHGDLPGPADPSRSDETTRRDVAAPKVD